MSLAEEHLSLIERIGSEDERMEEPFCSACLGLAAEMRALTHAQLARLLAWLDDHDCYYHPEICELKDKVLKEAAARLRSLESSR